MADPKKDAVYFSEVEDNYDRFRKYHPQEVFNLSSIIMNDRIASIQDTSAISNLGLNTSLGTAVDIFLGLTMAAARDKGTRIEDGLTRKMLVEGGMTENFQTSRAITKDKLKGHRKDMIKAALDGKDGYGSFSLEPNNIVQLTLLHGLNGSPQERQENRDTLQTTLGKLTDSRGRRVNLDRMTTHDLYETLQDLLYFNENNVNEPFKMTIGRRADNREQWDSLPTVIVKQGQAAAIAALAIGIQAPTEVDLQKMEDLPIDNAVNVPNGKTFTLTQAMSVGIGPLK
ncbi:MAG: hypothetical protein MRY32_06950 [Rickettsiales bacterium]|nr:hypothetical protein [Rickettsiales bacterium]